MTEYAHNRSQVATRFEFTLLLTTTFNLCSDLKTACICVRFVRRFLLVYGPSPEMLPLHEGDVPNSVGVSTRRSPPGRARVGAASATAPRAGAGGDDTCSPTSSRLST